MHYILLGAPVDIEQFVKIFNDPTKCIESKIQKCDRKLKSKVWKDEYLKTHPTGSSLGKLHGNA